MVIVLPVLTVFVLVLLLSLLLVAVSEGGSAGGCLPKVENYPLTIRIATVGMPASMHTHSKDKGMCARV